VTVAPQTRSVIDPVGLRVTYGGIEYPAAEVARGAAYELFSEYRVEGFRPNPRSGGASSWHRFVHVTDVTAVHGASADGSSTSGSSTSGPSANGPSAHGVEVHGVEAHGEPPDAPLQAPVSRARSWTDVHRMAQTPRRGEESAITAIRNTARIRRGTRMMKVLSARQLAGHLHGWLPYGFCYREYDIAHLRTPDELRLLRTDNAQASGEPDIVYALRWGAVDATDYAVPFARTYPGLVTMSPHDRIGSPVLGTGFTPSEQHLIPEFVTADLADLPLTANATLLAYTPDGTEVVLYTYQPEQRGWIRMVGPQWRHLLAGVPEVPPDQEYVQLNRQTSSVRLVGWLRGEEYEAVADPPADFRVLAMTRAARYPVDALRRRTQYASWRGALCTVLSEEANWLRLRMCRPDQEHVVAVAAQCYERGVYELWAPAAEVNDRQVVDVEYVLTPPRTGLPWPRPASLDG
jgi:hypothetical protein